MGEPNPEYQKEKDHEQKRKEESNQKLPQKIKSSNSNSAKAIAQSNPIDRLPKKQFIIPERILKGNVLVAAKEFYTSHSITTEDKLLIVDVAGASGIPMSEEDIAQTVALAQKNIGFVENGIDGQWGRSTEAAIKNKAKGLNNKRSNGKNRDVEITDEMLRFLKELTVRDPTKAVPIQMDQTDELIHNGGYDKDVALFMKIVNKPGKKTTSIPYSFARDLVLKGNYALLELIVGVANFGVEIPPEHCDLLEKDPLRHSNDRIIQNQANANPFQRIGIGKNPTDYLEGGIGIAHFDSSAMHAFYTQFGVPAGMTKEQLYTNPKEITFTVINGKTVPTALKSGAKPKAKDYKYVHESQQWQDWAKSLVENHQDYLFRYWATQFWIPNAKKLKEMEHGTIQDLNVNVRITNSVSTTGRNILGMSADRQINVYMANKVPGHVVRQISNVQRVNVLIEYILEKEQERTKTPNQINPKKSE